MLDELAVTNLGVIRSARIEPGAGLVVLTGETGAGKTLLLGALRLLSGRQASTDRVGPDGDEAMVEGRFVAADGTETVAARRIVTGGRSKAYLDGAMAAVRDLEAELGRLVEIVGQHDRMALTRGAEVRRIVDGRLDAAGIDARDAYREAWREWTDLRREHETLGGDARALARERDLVEMQVAEIADSGFVPGDEERLRTTAARLRNAGTLAESLGAALAAASDDGGAAERLSGAVDALTRAARVDDTLHPLAAQAAETLSLVDGLATEIRRATEDLEHDEGELEATERRLAELGGLLRKYGADLGEVLAFGERSARRAAELDATLERAATIERDLAAARDELEERGARLRAAREEAGAELAASAAGHLRDLGLRDPVVAVAAEPAEPGPDGADRLEIRFASDEALTPGPVSRVASGGELSRLVLALRLAGGAGEAPVVAFDEVDAGVGGTTALEVGRKLAALAEGRQVLCVTHLPQVAAFADDHFVVTRVGAVASVTRIDGAERLEELSRMLSGLPDSDRGREHADELLALAAAERPGP